MASSAVLCAATPAAGFAQEPPIDPALRADSQKLMDLTGAAKMGRQISSMMSSQVLESLRRANPNISERTITLSKEVLERFRRHSTALMA